MKTLILKTPSFETLIRIGEGLVDRLESQLGTLHESVLLADKALPSSLIEHVAMAASCTDVVRIGVGESEKTLRTYERIVTYLSDRRYSPATTLVALGGGSLGDIAGFVAATYARGIKYIYVPTTLLAMADASVGGKTALNVRHRKNIIGAFHQAEDVFIDPTLVKTLPPREIASGMAEIVKAALIGDARLYAGIRDDNPSLEALIAGALRVKIPIVEADPFDRGRRRLLNYGHTLAHALETYHEGRYSHGQCVASGMLHMARGLPFEHELSAVFARYDIDTDIPYDPETLFELVTHDKKRRGDTLDIALVETIGKGFVKTIPFHEFKTFLKGWDKT